MDYDLRRGCIVNMRFERGTLIWTMKRDESRRKGFLIDMGYEPGLLTMGTMNWSIEDKD